MSYTELHTGKFKIVAKNNAEIKKYVEDNNLSNKLSISKYNEWYINDEDYIITHIRDSNEHVMIKFIEHIELDPDDYIAEFGKDNSDEVSFVCQFYNGGTCLNELIEDYLNVQN
ncbi:hypothetical protein J6O48_07240 [bacterium]|nr:hypothetical protein [bacterium]